MRRYINLSNLFCIIDKKLVLPRGPFLSDLDLHRETRRINIIRAFVGVARVNIFMRIYTRLLYVPSNKMSRVVNISRKRGRVRRGRLCSFPSASETQGVFAFGGQAAVSLRQKPATENNANILRYSMLKQRTKLLFPLSFARGLYRDATRRTISRG